MKRTDAPGGDQETAVEMALKRQNKAERELDTAERELELMRLATRQQVCLQCMHIPCRSFLQRVCWSLFAFSSTHSYRFQPAAVALRFDVDFEDIFTDAAGLGSFIAQLQEDICFALHVPRATVQVLLFKRGSMVSVAEVLLNTIIDHSYPVIVKYGSSTLRPENDALRP
jgi:hypothetical protein